MKLPKYYRGIVDAYPEAVQLGLVDSRIRGLVAALNAKGMIATVASSEGRGILGCYSSPYVSFRTDATIASALHALLTREQGARPRRLHYTWAIEEYCNDQGEQVYHLSVPNVTQRLHWGRKHFDRDLQVIASVVGQIDYRVSLARGPARKLKHDVSSTKPFRLSLWSTRWLAAFLLVEA